MYSKEQRRAYNNARHHRLRNEAIEKLGGKCNKCGSMSELHFDHVDADTKSNVRQSLFNYSKEFIEKELQKCQLLCSACHLEKSKVAGDLRRNRVKGSKIKTSKLTEAQVLEIKNLLQNTSTWALALKYGVSQRSISNIKSGACWAHI